jgi:uncharacterized lipoprotein YddW (UPF0748 family)
MRRLCALLAAVGAAASSVRAQPPASNAPAVDVATGIPTPPPVLREFRGVWVATVDNIDWPSQPGLSTAKQKAELIAILDKAASLHLNAVIFQVRPSADAVYESKLEPWSSFLTGRMGRAPDPLWDPLAFAVREAHARGLELHAWFNPFRARYPGDDGPAARSHVSQRRPDLVHQYGHYEWIDPGSAQARATAIRVILDVVKRYDVDGVHIDDTFYPYPVTSGGRDVPFPDAATYAAYRRAGGTRSHDDWRRHNVDLFVEQLYHAVKAAKPWVKVGISPFGIWRPGSPPSVDGFDAYARLFADSRKWLANGWVDYLAPQLYWPIGQAGQSYADLLSWWVQQNAKGRNLWVGNYAARVAGTQGSAPPWPAAEILDQIRLTREEPGATGDIFFSMSTLMSDPDSLDERLLAGPYAAPALVPGFPWLGRKAPERPSVSVQRMEDEGMDGDGTGATVVRLQPGPGSDPRQWVVQARLDGVWHTRIVPGTLRTYRLDGALANADVVSAIAVDRVGNESEPAVVVRRVDTGR